MGMYNAPIKLFELPIKTIVEERESAILAKVQACFDVDVDKAELLRALQYDRNQYEKGYADGKADARAELVRCKDCKHYDNSEGICWCKINSKFYPGGMDWHAFPEDGFCSYGERKDNER